MKQKKDRFSNIRKFIEGTGCLLRFDITLLIEYTHPRVDERVMLLKAAQGLILPSEEITIKELCKKLINK